MTTDADVAMQLQSDVERYKKALEDIRHIACYEQGEWGGIDEVYAPTRIKPFRNIEGLCNSVLSKSSRVEIHGEGNRVHVSINDDKAMLQIWDNSVLQNIWVGPRAELVKALWPEGVKALENCDKAFASWQVGQIPGRPEDILTLINEERAALARLAPIAMTPGNEAPQTIDIGGYEVPLDLLRSYVDQVIHWQGETDGALRYELEKERERLHDAILAAIGLHRTDYPTYPNFDRALGDYIQDMQPKEDIQVHTLVTPPGFSQRCDLSGDKA